MFVGNVIVNVPEELFAKILSFTAAWCVVLTILVDTPAVPVVDMYLPIFLFPSFILFMLFYTKLSSTCFYTSYNYTYVSRT